MVQKKPSISRDLIIHPGETIADILEDREITQEELAMRTAVSPSYVSQVISGSKGISANFARKLEYALGVSKTFWLNLQAQYDAEMLEYSEESTITPEETAVYHRLGDIEKYLTDRAVLSAGLTESERILTMRSYFMLSDLCTLKDIAPSETVSDPYVSGAWRCIDIKNTYTVQQV